MGERYPDAYRRFLGFFRVGRFFEAHDVLEEQWRGDRQEFYKGLIQLAVGLHHAANGNAKGAEALLNRARGRLQRYQPVHLGLDVAAVVAGIDAARTAVEAGHDRPAVSLSIVDPQLIPLEDVATETREGGRPRVLPEDAPQAGEEPPKTGGSAHGVMEDKADALGF